MCWGERTHPDVLTRVKMPLLTLSGVTINFPFTPYECQNDYMSKVIECLQQKVNGVLESPTGTGKTLCLLCATLAWRDHFKDTISARKIAERLKGDEMFPDTPVATWGTAATDGDGTTYYTDIPKIIYASRTHSQLSQVVSELKNTAYREPAGSKEFSVTLCSRPKVCVLGSREQMCIHPEVMRQESNHMKVHMCKAKVAARSCTFYNNVEEKSTDKDLVNSIMDMEDLVKAGMKHRACPYYLSRTLKTQADIIFMPYNYLLDPKSRRAQNLDLKGAVVIFDEAHNVERICEESTSFDLTPYDLTSAIDVVNSVLKEKADDATSADPVADNFASGSMNSDLNLNISTIAKIKQMLLDLEAVIDSYEVSGEKGLTKPGSFIFELFKKANITFETKSAMTDALEQIISHVTGKTGIFMNTAGLQKLSEIFQLVFCGQPKEGNPEKEMQANTAQFRVHIHKDTSFNKKPQKVDVWAASATKKQGNILSYWCFSPGFSMQDLKNQGVRSIILTSGTLSPLQSFTAEMQIPFPVALENTHVIQRDQIFVGVVDQGPDGVQLSSTYDRRFVPENMASLGNTVANFGRVVPHGLLVFFPSYPVMDKTLEFWRANGHAGRIENMKPMFVEPKGKSNFNEVIEGYYNQVNDVTSKGGSFFAVCRGKASEGLDFSDNYGRAVIITGLPFPPKMDPRVMLKMQFLDETNRKKLPGVKCLSGSDWYRQQASRAVNQAIGRVIRHKEDFGAIFLCDRRFKNADVQAQLPRWLRPYIRRYDHFGTMVRDVSQFFRVAQKLRPLVPKAAGGGGGGAAGPERVSDAPGSSSGAQSARSQVPLAAQKAKLLEAHVPSLKRRRVDGGDGMARLSIQYNTEMPSSQRPGSLMDALAHSDRPRGAGGAGAPGEEMASGLSTRSLQHDKNMDDRSRGGKRKIKLVQEQKKSVPAGGAAPEENTHSKARRFLVELRKSLSQMNYQRVMDALQAYKRQDHLAALQEQASVLLVDANTHTLFRGLYQFLRPHHKKLFDEKCQELTGQGCGYKAEDSLSKEEKEALVLQQTASRARPGGSAPSLPPGNQLNTSQQLNGGGQHLGVHVSSGHLHRPGQTGDGKAPRERFLAAVKETFGAEVADQLLAAVRRYEEEDGYEGLITSAVGLLTQRDEGLLLLQGFEEFVRPHHKKQFKAMLGELRG